MLYILEEGNGISLRWFSKEFSKSSDSEMVISINKTFEAQKGVKLVFLSRYTNREYYRASY